MRLQVRAGAPLFNDAYCYMYLNYLCKTQTIHSALYVPSPCDKEGHVFDATFNATAADGRPVLDCRLLAWLDYAIGTCLHANMTEITKLRGSIYDAKLGLYELLNGKDGRRDWRAELKAALEQYVVKYPQALAKVRARRVSRESVGADAEEGDKEDQDARRAVPQNWL